MIFSIIFNFTIGISISRPLDRYDIVVVGKNPNDLKVNYEEMTKMISNSPTHRVMTSSDMIALNDDSNLDDNNHNNNRVSFAATVAVARNETITKNAAGSITLRIITIKITICQHF